ncbi:pericentriolar material 1 protein-like isoform X21 [Ptychodera flava]|uniref:pericentriolar material 1 protein-like isoform X21 n=2 Tax=Ptychodera flava TaxID=63121 RepID=UPI00396A1D97
MIGVISRSTMATGVTKASKGSSSEPRRPLYRSNPTDEDQLLNWNDLFDDRLNNLADWRPSSTFANQLRKEKKKKEPNRDRDREILQSAEASPSSRREKKRKEPNRDREMPLSAESPPSSSALRHHTPATYPRTQFSSVTTAAERSAIESLKQRLTFSETDDQSTDAEGAHAAANNERDVSRQRLLQPLQAQESNLLNDLDVPDRNQIVARLMQIRDYQKQASAMLSNLQNSTDRATNTDQLRKLERLIDHLKDQEKGYTGLLQRMLTDDPGLLAAQPNQENNSGESNTTSLAESTSINIDAQSDISEATTEEIDPAIQQEELEGLRQQHELLKKMVKQQEELRALQGRQQSLLQLQRQIESQLAETQREHDDNRDRDRQPPRERPQDKESNVRWRERDQGRGDRDDDTEPGLDLDVERRRLNLLQLLAEDREKRAAELMSARAADQRDRDVSESQLLAMASEHQELQDKLQALQEKKQQMDNLLQHLHTLRDQQLNNLDADSASASSSQQRINESIQATASANQTPHDATQELLDALEAREKLEKLREVRDRLNRLRDLVQYYQSGNEFIHSEPNPNEHTEETSSMADYEDPILMRNLRQLQREDVTRVSRQDRRESEISESTRGESQQRSDDGEEDEEEEEETEDMVDGNESNPGDKSDSENEEAESNHSSLLGAWGDDPEIQEKVKKLKAAKRKLRRLQELVAMVQQTPEAAEALPDDLAELAASIDGDIAADYDLDARGRRLSGQGKVDEKTREAYYMAKMRQQRGELSKLMEERQRLMTVQQQLKSLNEHFPQATLGKNPGGTRKRPTSAGTRSRRAMDSPRVSLPEGSEVESCNRELWSEMRRHKILREELRQKRKELEILLQESRRQRAMDNQSDRGTFSIQSDNNDGYGMSADVTTQATWGGSTTHLSDIDDEEVDDGYPSDGIVQVEEEEEQEDTSDHDTYTIEADYRHRLRRPQTSSEIVTSQQKKRKLMNEDEPTSRRPFSAGDRVYHSRWPFMGSIRPTRQQQENVRSAEELIQEDQKREDPKDTQSQLLLWQCQQLQQQLNTSTSLCHSLIRDMQSLTTLVQSSQTGNPSSMGYGAVPATPYGISPTSPPTPFNPPPSPFNETMHSYNMQLQQQQLMLNLNQAYNQLYAQQLEIRALQEHFQQLSTRDNENQNNSTAGSLRMPHSLDESRASSRPQFANQGVSPYARAHSSLNSQFNLTPQFPATFSYPSTYANHYDERLYASGNRRSADTAGYPRYERYDTSGRYDYLQLFQEANRNPWQDDAARTFPRRHEANDEDEADEEEEEGQAEEERRDFSRVPPLNLDDILKRAEKRRAARSQGNPAAVVTHVQSPDVVGTKFPSRTEATRNLAQKDRSKNPRAAYLSGYRPGLSSGISGTAFIDTASISSAMSSVPGALNDDGNRTGRSMKSTSDVDSDAPSDFSLFEALRENIYSEVATLISQNESRPHYLIELFRELQMLTSDYLRQRALYAVQDLVSRYLTEESLSRPLPSVPRPAWQASTNSEQTPSESIVTSDDEEVRARLYAQNPNLFGYTEPTISSYDYAENVSSASSLSTPTNSHVDSFGFANDDLGNTVIHLDKAMQRMREYERMKAEAEVEGKGASSSLSTPAKKDRTSDLTSNSSAQDVGSESSVSDVPYPRIDTGQLDRQIKNIMQEVIPYLKEHMDDVCSPQLLAYIRRLVLTLTRQRGDSQEFVRFFNKQLGSILQDSLSKFAGRKMRECGEDLLVDISEILFNELAFFRLMQDLDSTGVGVMSRRHEDSETTGTDTGAGQTGTGEGDLFALLSMALSSQSGESTSEESDDEESSDEDSDSGSSDGEEEEEEKELQNVETAMAITPAEEEELGKVARDDAMAANFDVNDKDEDSETMATKTVKIELSVSESKPHTSTGSGEEDEEQDTVSEVQEYTTTIMAATAANEGFDAEIQDTQAAESATKQKEQSEEEKEEDTTEKVETMEEKEEDSAQKAETAENPAEDPAPTEVHVLQVNGDSAAQDKEDENEVTIDDLPGSLTSLSQIQLQEKMDEEQAGNTAVQAALEVLESGGESELAGDADSLKNPDASLPEDAVEGKAQSNQISNDESESE